MAAEPGIRRESRVSSSRRMALSLSGRESDLLGERTDTCTRSRSEPRESTTPTPIL